MRNLTATVAELSCLCMYIVLVLVILLFFFLILLSLEAISLDMPFFLTVETLYLPSESLLQPFLQCPPPARNVHVWQLFLHLAAD